MNTKTINSGYNCELDSKDSNVSSVYDFVTNFKTKAYEKLKEKFNPVSLVKQYFSDIKHVAGDFLSGNLNLYGNSNIVKNINSSSGLYDKFQEFMFSDVSDVVSGVKDVLSDERNYGISKEFSNSFRTTAIGASSGLVGLLGYKGTVGAFDAALSGIKGAIDGTDVSDESKHIIDAVASQVGSAYMFGTTAVLFGVAGLAKQYAKKNGYDGVANVLGIGTGLASGQLLLDQTKIAVDVNVDNIDYVLDAIKTGANKITDNIMDILPKGSACYADLSSPSKISLDYAVIKETEQDNSAFQGQKKGNNDLSTVNDLVIKVDNISDTNYNKNNESYKSDDSLEKNIENNNVVLNDKDISLENEIENSLTPIENKVKSYDDGNLNSSLNKNIDNSAISNNSNNSADMDEKRIYDLLIPQNKTLANTGLEDVLNEAKELISTPVVSREYDKVIERYDISFADKFISLYETSKDMKHDWFLKHTHFLNQLDEFEKDYQYLIPDKHLDINNSDTMHKYELLNFLHDLHVDNESNVTDDLSADVTLDIKRTLVNLRKLSIRSENYKHDRWDSSVKEGTRFNRDFLNPMLSQFSKNLETDPLQGLLNKKYSVLTPEAVGKHNNSVVRIFHDLDTVINTSRRHEFDVDNSQYELGQFFNSIMNAPHIKNVRNEIQGKNDVIDTPLEYIKSLEAIEDVTHDIYKHREFVPNYLYDSLMKKSLFIPSLVLPHLGVANLALGFKYLSALRLLDRNDYNPLEVAKEVLIDNPKNAYDFVRKIPRNVRFMWEKGNNAELGGLQNSAVRLVSNFSPTGVDNAIRYHSKESVIVDSLGVVSELIDTTSFENSKVAKKVNRVAGTLGLTGLAFDEYNYGKMLFSAVRNVKNQANLASFLDLVTLK